MSFGGRGEETRFPWRGKLEAMAIYNRVVEANEAAADFAAYQQILASRRPLPQFELQARLIATSAVPKPAEIAPYRDALIVNEYQVEKVLRGKYDAKTVRVAEWGLIDAQTTAVASAKTGDQAQFVVESFGDHPELEAEVLRDSLAENLDLPLHLDVTIRPSGAPRIAGVTVTPREVWIPKGTSFRFSTAAMFDQYGNPIDAKVNWSVTPGGTIETGNFYGGGLGMAHRQELADGSIDQNGLFTSDGTFGIATIVATAQSDPAVKGIASVAVDEIPAISAWAGPLRFGGDSNEGNRFVGDIDRARIYDRPLSDAEIAAHAAGKGMDDKNGLVAEWTFDEELNGTFPNAIGSGLVAKRFDRSEVQNVTEHGRSFVRFNGKGFLEVAPDSRLGFRKTATLEAWIRQKNGGSVIDRLCIAGVNVGYGFCLTTQGSVDIIGMTGHFGVRYEIPKNTWVHVVGVFDINEARRLYVDGKLIGERPAGPLVTRK